MKRFYCTECKRMKRVRNYPRSVRNQEAINPKDRQGVCNYHSYSNPSRYSDRKRA